MSPVTSLVLLLAFSYVSTSILPDQPEKPVACPADVDFPTCTNPAIFYSECEIDRDCRGKGICCFSGCRKRCLLPLQDKTDSCPYVDNSICVHVKPAPSECQSDDQCQGTERCCFFGCRHQCTPTVKGVKPGTCPEFSLSESCPKQVPPPECSADDGCPGGEKCCKDPCGAVKCTEPLAEVKPGRCPPFRRLGCTFPLPPPDCYNDQWCPFDQKCCFYSCKKECLNPYTGEESIDLDR